MIYARISWSTKCSINREYHIVWVQIVPINHHGVCCYMLMRISYYAILRNIQHSTSLRINVDVNVALGIYESKVYLLELRLYKIGGDLLICSTLECISFEHLMN